MPAYNEQATIRTIVARVLAVDLGPIEQQLVIVDGGSDTIVRFYGWTPK